MPMKIVTTQSQTFDPIAEGVWEADVTRFFEWKEFNRFDNEEREGIKVEFTITEGEQRERKAYRFLSPFLTQRSILMGLWKAIRGAEPTAEELASIQDISDLIGYLGGRPVKILVKNRTSAKGTTYYTVADFVKSSRKQGEFPFEQGAPEGMKMNLSNSTVPTNQETPTPVSIPEPAPAVAPTPAQPAQSAIKSIADEMDAEEAVPQATGKKVV